MLEYFLRSRQILVVLFLKTASSISSQPSVSFSLPSERPNEPMLTKYEEAVRRLYQVNLWNPVKLGLENSEALHRLIGSPMKNKRIVHVAGTNGKGSVAWKIARALREAGYRDGLFVSPHLASFRERIQIGGTMISEEEVSTGLPWIYDLCREHSVPATFFELTTALAFHHFKAAEVVVLEVGLGGRLDATNVVTPTVSVITSIGLDHTRILGDTVEEIALEKAGVMKPGVPVVVGPRVPQSVLKARALEVGSPFHQLTSPQGSTADFDDENSDIARSTLRLLCALPGFERLDERCIEVGLATRPPCRFEELNVSWDPIKRQAQLHADKQSDADKVDAASGTGAHVILDVGHNPPALQGLVARLAKAFPGRPLRFVLGMSRDKDIGECVGLLLAALPSLEVSHIHLVAAEHPRAAPPDFMLERVSEAGLLPAEDTNRLFSVHFADGDTGSVTGGVHAALDAVAHQRKANQSAAGGGEESAEEVVIVCGSVFIMAEARAALGFNEPQDSNVISEVAGSHLKHIQEMFPAADPPVK
mmetsp:Transcript_39400/g.79563  ORF Transcript_39400/g.79563 Transcript_39400/m.79563 type:complete len:534 (+) Transcript_39400:21-1622(+)